MAAGLLLDAHGRCLRELAAAAGQHFEGLAQAARCRRLELDPKLRRRLRELDTVAAWLRHVTAPRVDLLLLEVAAALVTAEGGPLLAGAVSTPEGSVPALPDDAAAGRAAALVEAYTTADGNDNGLADVTGAVGAVGMDTEVPQVEKLALCDFIGLEPASASLRVCPLGTNLGGGGWGRGGGLRCWRG